MGKKRYTAQEIRAVADTPIYIGNDCANRTQRLMRDMLRQAADAEEELAKVKASKNRWMQYQETATGERNACIDELRKKDAEIKQLKAQLGAVVKECEKMRDDFLKRMRSFTGMGASNMKNIYKDKIEVVYDILRLARGELENENE